MEGQLWGEGILHRNLPYQGNGYGDIQLSKMHYKLLLFRVNSGIPPTIGTRIILPVLITVAPRKVFLESFLFSFLSVKLSVGCGDLIRFWLDPRLDSVPLQTRFPYLYNISTLKDGAISSFLPLSSGWDFYFPGNLRASEIYELATLLSTIIISISSLPVLTSEFDSLFFRSVMVLTFYPAIIQSLLPSLFPHNIIQLSLSPSKVQAFLWKLAQNRGPTLDIIQSFYPHVSFTPPPPPLQFMSFLSLHC